MNVLLFCRVRSYITNGWADCVVNPDDLGCLQSQAVSVLQKDVNDKAVISSRPPTGNVWKDVRKVYTSCTEVPLFTYGQMMTYFVSRTLDDGLPSAGDFNGMNKKA